MEKLVHLVLFEFRMSHNFPVTDYWEKLHERTEYSPVYVAPQDGLMQADKLEKLPGQPGNVDFDQYAGFVTVDPQAGRALFYYFVTNSSTNPLALWLNGGPGCSSFGYGAMNEVGPFRVNSDGRTLYRNNYSWNNDTPEKNQHPLISPTSSRPLPETINGSYRFVLTGFSLSKGIGIGKYIMSDIFTVGEYDWAIYFYPDGKNPDDNATYVSAFIVLMSEEANVKALFELTLVDQSGKGHHKVHSQLVTPPESGPYTLQCPGSMWGYKRFYSRAMLETSDHLKDDCLEINCSVGVVVSATE